MEEKTKNKLIKIFGFISRTIFIIVVGCLGYSWLMPDYSVGDTPISQLTLGGIFGQIMAVFLLIGCILWFFKFPEDEENYKLWAFFGGIILLIIFVLMILFPNL